MRVVIQSLIVTYESFPLQLVELLKLIKNFIIIDQLSSYTRFFIVTVFFLIQ